MTRLAAGRNRVAVADLPVDALDPQLAAASVADNLAPSVDGFGLGARHRARTIVLLAHNFPTAAVTPLHVALVVVSSTHLGTSEGSVCTRCRGWSRLARTEI